MASVGGLLFIMTVRTVGGINMDLAFSVYGVLFFVFGIMTWKRQHQGHLKSHGEWATRWFALAVGSGLFRLAPPF
jgi:hypothetical protein